MLLPSRMEKGTVWMQFLSVFFTSCVRFFFLAREILAFDPLPPEPRESFKRGKLGLGETALNVSSAFNNFDFFHLFFSKFTIQF